MQKRKNQCLSLGSAIKGQFPGLQDVPRDALEERILGRRNNILPAYERLANRALTKYLSDPSGKRAKEFLGNVFCYTEMMPEDRREEAAKRYARLIYNAPVSLKGKSRKQAQDIIMSACVSSSYLGSVLEIESSEIRRQRRESREGIASSFDSFISVPSETHAADHLRSAIESIERIGNPAERTRTASHYAQELLRHYDCSNQTGRNHLNNVMKSVLAEDSSFRDALTSMARKGQSAGGTGVFSKTQIVASWLDENARDELLPGLDPDGSKRYVLHRDRNNNIDVQVVSKAMAERMLGKIADVIAPRLNLIKWIGVASLMLVGVGAFVGGNYIVQSQVSYTIGKRSITLKELASELRRAVTPKEIVLGEATTAAIEKVQDKPAIVKAFAIFDYVVKNIKNERTPDYTLPQTPKQTLAWRRGDCRAKSILIASMAENIGIETILVWLPPLPGGVGHMYAGLKISDHVTGDKAKMDKLLVEGSLVERYGKKGANPNFITFEKNGLKGTYLMLDATFLSPENAAPGQKPSNKEFGEPKGFDAYVGDKPPASTD